MNDITFILIHIFTGMIAFLSNEEAPAVMTVRDWINTYYGRDPYDTVLDTGGHSIQHDNISQSF